MGRCCLTWHAALDDLFTRAVLGMKVNEALVWAGSCGTSCVFCFCFRRAPSKTKFVLLWPQSLLSSGSCSNRLIPYCKCSLPLQNTPSWPFPVFSKQQQQTRLPMLLLSTPVLFSLVDVVSAGGKGLMLSVIGGGALGFSRSAGLLDAGRFMVFMEYGKSLFRHMT